MKEINLEHQKWHLFYVPKELIRQALADMQHNYSFGYSYIRDCAWLPEDDTYAVQVVFSCGYPYLESEFHKKWHRAPKQKPQKGWIERWLS